MRTEVKILGGASFFQGSVAEVINFSSTEDATTIDPSNYNGGFGQLTVTARPVQDTKMALGKNIMLSDSDKGKTTGVVRQVSITDKIATFTGDSVLGLFNTYHTVGPQIGTLEQAINAYCDVVGITNLVEVHESLAELPVQFPGFKGNVWDNIKRIMAALQIELALVYDKVVVRPLRQLEANLERNTTITESVDAQTASKYVEVCYYPTETIIMGEVYPVVGEEANILQVDAGETREFTLTLKSSISTLNQPLYTEFVQDRPYEGGMGVYTVAANDGLPMTRERWVAQGGSLSVRMGEDSSTVIVNITGASDVELAPYRIAMTSGSGNFYNALHITGSGVRWTEEMITLTTGASSEVTGEEVGATVQNPYIQTLEQAYTTGLRASGAYAGPVYSVTGTALNINRAGGNRDAIAATFNDYNVWWIANHFGEFQFANFNAAWNDSSFAEFNAFWDARMATLFTNQAFGNAVGARVRLEDAYFRIDNATISPQSINYSASLDTLIGDYTEVNPAQTFEDFNFDRVGYTFSDFATTPLRTY